MSVVVIDEHSFELIPTIELIQPIAMPLAVLPLPIIYALGKLHVTSTVSLSSFPVTNVV